MIRKIKSGYITLLFLASIAFAVTEESIFVSGLNYYIKRQFKDAAAEWKKILDINPIHPKAKLYMEKAYTKYNDMEVHFYLGLDLFNQTEYGKAIPHFQETLMINPRHEKAIFYLNLCYQLLKETEKKDASEKTKIAAEKFFAEEEYRKAVIMYKALLLLHPDDKSARLKLAEAEEKLHQQDLKDELQLHLEAARDFEAKAKYLAAIGEFSKALLIAPENIEAKEGVERCKKLLEQEEMKAKIQEYLSRGIELFLTKEYNKAKIEFQNVLKLDSENQVAKDYLKKLENIEKLEADLIVARAEAEKHFQQGVSFYNQEQYEDALSEFELTLELEPSHQEAQKYKEWTLQKLKLQKEQQEKRNQELIELYLKEGITYYGLQKYEAAISSLEKCLQLAPENVYAKEYLKLASDALLLQEQSDVSPDSPYYEIVQSLLSDGEKYYKLQNFQLSLKFFEQIKELFPFHKIANKYLLKITFNLNKNEWNNLIGRYIQTGKDFLAEKKYNNALETFKIVQEVAPDYPGLQDLINSATIKPKANLETIKNHYNKGMLYWTKNKLAEAISEWKHVIELDPSPTSNKYLAIAIVNINKAEYRLKLIRGETKKETPIVDSKNTLKIKKHYYLGVGFYTSGQYEAAIQEWKKVLKLDPRHPEALKNIQKCEQKLKIQGKI